MKFEVFHRGLLGRPDIIAVDMIHYSGLWGLCFSHHPPHNNHPRYAADTTTAGVLRFLEAAHSGRDAVCLNALADYTLTTHHVDADAVLPVWALLHPEEARERREQLERIARCGDFFIYLDDPTAKINFTVEKLHQRLRGGGASGERVVDESLTRACFDWLLPRLRRLLDKPAEFAEFWEPPLRAMHADLEYLALPGRVTELWNCHTSLAETDHAPDTHALNSVCRNDLLLVWRTDTRERRLEVRPAIGWYELTSMPHRPRYDLAALGALLNAAEQAAGSPASAAWEYRAGAVSLHADDSRLTQETLCAVIRSWLDASPETQVSAAYRADVRETFSCLPYHAVFTCHERFAQADELRFVPGGAYGGLYALRASTVEIPGLICALGDKAPLAFTVSDDFYWNRATPEPLTLESEIEDRGPGKVWMEFDAWNERYRVTAPVALCGDGRTKTVTFPLDDARLGNSLEGGADLRLMRTVGTPLAVRRLTLRKSAVNSHHRGHRGSQRESPPLPDVSQAATKSAFGIS